MKNIFKIFVFVLVICLVSALAFAVFAPKLDSKTTTNHRSENNVSEDTTTFEEPTDSETDEPETPSSVMYKHTVSLYYRPSEWDEYIYTFEVLSSSSTEFEVVSDIPDGTYSVVDQWNTPSVLYIDQGVNYWQQDGRPATFDVSALVDVVTPA